MSLDETAQKPHDRLGAHLAADMERVNALIRERMASEHAPRIPEVTRHLVEAGGKIKEQVSKSEAEEVQKKLQEAGAEVELA